MVRARRLVFDAGLYRPIIDAVATTVSLSAPASIVDAGCGEGSYLAQATAVSGAGGWGFDISKPAVRLASRRHTTHHYAIASSYAMPFSDDSFDAIINVFSPRDFGEMERVLVAGGVAVVVTPGPRHLAALKAMIYDDPREHLDRAGATDHAADTDEPSPDNIEAVSFELQLNDSTLRLALLEMTPFWWSTVPERRAAIAATDFTVEVDVRISTYRKTAT
jgi:23S rRNA (guanine745-N1)-methyltransferase